MTSLTTSDALNASNTTVDDQLQGFRLQKFSVLNWGTFDQQIWQLNPEQQNSLLTGNIGSGKSTLVDGLTTLLVPTRKLSFNKAAGASDKERSLESYFHGFYTSQQDEYGKARAKGLRSDKHYSVILAQFHSNALAQTITLAQVFWLKPGDKKVKRLFVVAKQALTIAEHFVGFGQQMNQLRKRLRKQEKLEVFDTFPPYAQHFSKLLGLGSDGKALELFNQTISMKSVGSVTDFVRQNMLEQPDVEAQLQELERNYDDLKRLHDAVVAARQKVDLLTPVNDYGLQTITAAKDKNHIEQCRELTDVYMAEIAIDLYQSRLGKQTLSLEKLDIKIVALELAKTKLGETINQLHQDIRNNGGGRIAQLDKEMRQLTANREQSRQLCQNYEKLVTLLELNTVLSPESFIDNINGAKDLQESLQSEDEYLGEQSFVIKTKQQSYNKEKTAIEQEIAALKQRKSNIGIKQLNIRERLCQQLKVSEDRLPFVGELIQVKKSATKWQGAIERVMHNFALSLMVPEDLYRDVCDFVEQTHLGTRLVYYRVHEPQNYFPITSEQDSLLQKIELKSDSEHYNWLHKELHHRFDYLCCADMDDFRRVDKALTPSGQIKSGKFRHEKDDRYNIFDKSRYVLGWSNQEKIQLLAANYNQVQQRISEISQQLTQVNQQQQALTDTLRQAKNLAEFDFSFEQINWPQLSQQIEQLQQEKQALEQASDILKDLQKNLNDKLINQQNNGDSLKVCYTEQGQYQQALKSDENELAQKQQLFNSVEPSLKAQCFPTIAKFYQKHINDKHLRLNMLTNISSELRHSLTVNIGNLEQKRNLKSGQMIKAMACFANAFPNDVTEVDQSFEALGEYQHMLKKLTDEDLPRHEARFKEMLNRDTIRAMALFRSYLDKQEEDIDSRIRLINQSLHELDYQNGTYIEIDSIASPDVEVRDFKQRLKQCVEFSSDDDLYSEEKFQRVKDLIEQMRNEPKWTKKSG